jgi:hypothetical protein
MEHPPFSRDLAPKDFWLFSEIKLALKGRRFRVIEDVQTYVTMAGVEKNISNSGSISCIGLSASMLKRSTSKVTPLSRLFKYTGYKVKVVPVLN